MFDEKQIYRIDHYLGKETVQNILVLRFANSIFEPLFNQRYVDHVQITVAEEEGVGTRAGYYEQAGALRDMVQNHMLQLLSLVAMEPPHSLDADVIRDEKLEVLQSLRPLDGADDRRQRGARAVRRLPRTRQGVEPDVAHRDLRRAAGLHRQLALGRRAVLPADRQAAAEARQRDLGPPEGRSADPVQRRTRPGVSSRTSWRSGFSRTRASRSASARKRPGPHVDVAPVKMDFHYGETFGDGSSPEAYERLLLDVMNGDPTLFMRRDAVEDGVALGDADARSLGGADRRRWRPTRPAPGDRRKPTG